MKAFVFWVGVLLLLKITELETLNAKEVYPILEKYGRSWKLLFNPGGIQSNSSVNSKGSNGSLQFANQNVNGSSQLGIGNEMDQDKGIVLKDKEENVSANKTTDKYNMILDFMRKNPKNILETFLDAFPFHITDFFDIVAHLDENKTSQENQNATENQFLVTRNDLMPEEIGTLNDTNSSGRIKINFLEPTTDTSVSLIPLVVEIKKLEEIQEIPDDSNMKIPDFNYTEYDGSSGWYKLQRLEHMDGKEISTEASDPNFPKEQLEPTSRLASKQGQPDNRNNLSYSKILETSLNALMMHSPDLSNIMAHDDKDDSSQKIQNTKENLTSALSDILNNIFHISNSNENFHYHVNSSNFMYSFRHPDNDDSKSSSLLSKKNPEYEEMSTLNSFNPYKSIQNGSLETTKDKVVPSISLHTESDGLKKIEVISHDSNMMVPDFNNTENEKFIWWYRLPEMKDMDSQENSTETSNPNFPEDTLDSTTNLALNQNQYEDQIILSSAKTLVTSLNPLLLHTLDFPAIGADLNDDKTSQKNQNIEEYLTSMLPNILNNIFQFSNSNENFHHHVNSSNYMYNFQHPDNVVTENSFLYVKTIPLHEEFDNLNGQNNFGNVVNDSVETVMDKLVPSKSLGVESEELVKLREIPRDSKMKFHDSYGTKDKGNWWSKLLKIEHLDRQKISPEASNPNFPEDTSESTTSLDLSQSQYKEQNNLRSKKIFETSQNPLLLHSLDFPAIVADLDDDETSQKNLGENVTSLLQNILSNIFQFSNSNENFHHHANSSNYMYNFQPPDNVATENYFLYTENIPLHEKFGTFNGKNNFGNVVNDSVETSMDKLSPSKFLNVKPDELAKFVKLPRDMKVKFHDFYSTIEGDSWWSKLLRKENMDNQENSPETSYPNGLDDIWDSTTGLDLNHNQYEDQISLQSAKTFVTSLNALLLHSPDIAAIVTDLNEDETSQKKQNIENKLTSVLPKIFNKIFHISDGNTNFHHHVNSSNYMYNFQRPDNVVTENSFLYVKTIPLPEEFDNFKGKNNIGNVVTDSGETVMDKLAPSKSLDVESKELVKLREIPRDSKMKFHDSYDTKNERYRWSKLLKMEHLERQKISPEAFNRSFQEEHLEPITSVVSNQNQPNEWNNQNAAKFFETFLNALLLPSPDFSDIVAQFDDDKVSHKIQNKEDILSAALSYIMNTILHISDSSENVYYHANSSNYMYSFLRPDNDATKSSFLLSEKNPVYEALDTLNGVNNFEVVENDSLDTAKDKLEPSNSSVVEVKELPMFEEIHRVFNMNSSDFNNTTDELTSWWKRYLEIENMYNPKKITETFYQNCPEDSSESTTSLASNPKHHHDQNFHNSTKNSDISLISLLLHHSDLSGIVELFDQKETSQENQNATEDKFLISKFMPSHDKFGTFNDINSFGNVTSIFWETATDKLVSPVPSVVKSNVKTEKIPLDSNMKIPDFHNRKDEESSLWYKFLEIGDKDSRENSTEACDPNVSEDSSELNLTFIQSPNGDLMFRPSTGSPGLNKPFVITFQGNDTYITQ